MAARRKARTAARSTGRRRRGRPTGYSPSKASRKKTSASMKAYWASGKSRGRRRKARSGGGRKSAVSRHLTGTRRTGRKMTVKRSTRKTTRRTTRKAAPRKRSAASHDTVRRSPRRRKR